MDRSRLLAPSNAKANPIEVGEANLPVTNIEAKWMFDSLKKKLKESVEKLTKKADERQATEAPKSVMPEPPKAEPPKPSPKKEAARPAKTLTKPEAGGKATMERRRQESPSERIAFRPETKEPPKTDMSRPVKAVERHVPEAPAPGSEYKDEEKRGFFGRMREKVGTRHISDSDIEEFFRETETEMLESNVALEVVDFLKQSLKEKLAGYAARRFGTADFVREAFEESLYDVLNQGKIDLEEIISKAKSEGRPACLIFLGFNGSGKTTSMAKLAQHLKDTGHKPVLAAADTFRAASIEQLEVHGERLGMKVIKHQYGADSAAVIFDAVKFAKTRGYDIVLADTAGRSHVDKNLMDELSKVMRVNKPDLKVLVVDSLTGNDAVEQAKTFQKAAGVDAIVLTKIDVNKKGGAILSVCYAIKKPILFLGTGQEYGNIEIFEPRKFAKELLE
jgi:fused signal recognition particle receptor